MKDQQMGRIFLKLVKERQIAMDHFAIGFMLVLLKIPSIKKTVLTIMARQLQERAIFSNHIPICWNEDNYLWILDDVEKHLMHVVIQLRGSREYICSELSDLAFFLIDNKPKDVKLPSTEESLMVNPIDLARIGKNIIQEIFRHETAELRSYIMNELLTRIITGSSSVHSQLALLANIISSNPVLWHDYESKFNDTIEYMILLPQDVASGLLKAMQPLFEVDPHLPDKLIKILRKSLFSTEQTSRTIAISGFFTLLDGLAEVQAGSMISSTFNPDRLVSVEVELLGLMKRGLSLQSEVRKQLYEGYISAAERKPHLREIIFRHLNEQLSRCYTESPRYFIKFDSVIDENKIIVMEPAAHLLFCCQRCVTLFGQEINVNADDAVDDVDEEDDIDDDVDGGVIERGVPSGRLTYSAKKHLREIAKKLECIRESLEIEETMTDFGFEKNIEYSPESEEGRENLLRAYVALGIHLAILEYTVMTAVTKRETTRAKDVATLSFEKIFHRYIDLRDTVSRRSKPSSRKQSGARSRGNSVISDKLYIPTPSLDFVTEMVKLIVPNVDNISDECDQSELLSEPKFFAFVMQLARTHIINAKEQCEKDPSREKLSQLVTPLGKLCNALILVGQYLSAHWDDSDSTGRKSKRSSKSTSPEAIIDLVLDCVDMVARSGAHESEILVLIGHVLEYDTSSNNLSAVVRKLHTFADQDNGLSLLIAFGLLLRMSTLPSFDVQLHKLNLRWLNNKDDDSTYVMDHCQNPRVATIFFDMLFRYRAMAKRFDKIESLCSTIAQYATGGGESSYIIPDSAETSALESSISIVQKILASMSWKQSLLQLLSKILLRQRETPSSARLSIDRVAEERTVYNGNPLVSQSSTTGSDLENRARSEEEGGEEVVITSIMDIEVRNIYHRHAVTRRIFEHMFEIPRYIKGCDRLMDAFLSFISLSRNIVKEKSEEYIAEERRLKRQHPTLKRGNPKLKPEQNFEETFVVMTRDTNALVQLFDDFVKNVSNNIDELPKSTLQRWGRIHPEIDSIINEYERHLATLSKKTNVNLLQNATARLTDNVNIVFSMVKAEDVANETSQEGEGRNRRRRRRIPASSSSSSSSTRNRPRRRQITDEDEEEEEEEHENYSRKRSRRR